MTLRGITIQAVRSSIDPAALAPRRDGTVLAVHRSALNLRLVGGLAVIAPVAAGGLPGALLVPNGFAPVSAGVRPGMTATIGPDGEIVIGDLTITTRRARPWSARLEALGAPPLDLAERRAALATVLAGSGADGFTMPGTRRRLEAFLDIAASGSVERVTRGGNMLVGLGAGLTPAGDDVLVGFSAALVALGHGGAARSLARAWARSAAGRTTVVAEAYHRHAAHGDYAERLHALLRAVVHGAPGEIARATGATTRFGATSGVDLVLGVLAGLDHVLAAGARVGGTEAAA